MKQRIILWIGALLLLTAGAGCEKEGKVASEDVSTPQQQGQPDSNQPEEEPVIPTALIGSWKLAGFVHTPDNAFEEIKPKDCAKCYTITFLQDGTFTGYTLANDVRGKYKIDETLHIVNWEGASVNEQPEEKRYVSAMHNISRINFMGDLLKLYYDNSQNQLLFYRNKNEALPVIPSELIGSWKLEGFGNTADNTFRDAEPKDCTVCYTLIFLSNGVLTGKSSTNEMIGEYKIKGRSLSFLKLGGTEINELFDGQKYVEALYQVHRFEIVSQKLKLYYNDGKNYLQFKRVAGVTDGSMDDERIEISPDGEQTVIEQKINGIAFKFCLLNEQGKPATVFKEGENFTFYFRIKNETKKNFYYNAYPCAYAKDFFSISYSSGKTVGKSYEALAQEDIGIAAYPFNNNDSYTFKVAWVHPEESIVQGGDFRYKSLKRKPLRTGNYYTSFSHKFKLFPVSGDKHIETENIYFKINFKIE